MVSTPARRPRAILRFTHVEVQWAGQAFRLGRYPIHFHMHGDANMQSWVKGCSIHHSFLRAVTIHGTHRVLLENNVAYDVMGHTYFFEDALEWGEGRLRSSFSLKAVISCSYPKKLCPSMLLT
jgi:hypothetical protein